MDLVVDTWVWETAQARSGTVACFESVELLAKVCKSTSHALLGDYEDEIKSEYDAHVRDELVKHFYVTIVFRGRFKKRGRTSITLTRHFDPDDLKFIEVAYVLPRAPVISGDSDFLELRNHLDEEPSIAGLEILTPGEIVARL